MKRWLSRVLGITLAHVAGLYFCRYNNTISEEDAFEKQRNQKIREHQYRIINVTTIGLLVTSLLFEFIQGDAVDTLSNARPQYVASHEHVLYSHGRMSSEDGIHHAQLSTL
jgi:hypothetical protein